MANKILGFGTAATNELTDAAYAADAQRLSGNVPGVARSALVNKAAHQASAIAAGVAEFLATRQAADIVDTLTPSQIATMLSTILPSAVVGSARNLFISIATASTSAPVTADEVVVKTAIGAAGFTIPSFSRTLNVAGTGVGGMDTGAAPVSGFVAVYAIYNPTTGQYGLLGQNANVLRAEVYGGASMPAGYTHSALIAVLPTNGSSQFLAGGQRDRTFAFSPRTVISTGATVGSLTPQSIASAVPLNARSCDGTNSVAFSTTAGTSLSVTIASDVNGVGSRNVSNGGAAGTINRIDAPFANLILLTPQFLWYLWSIGGGTGQGLTVQISAYTI